MVGIPNYPVVLTSLYDTTVGAGFDPSGDPITDTVPYNSPAGADPIGPSAGNWQGINIEPYSDDYNAAVATNLGPTTVAGPQYLGELASSVDAKTDSSNPNVGLVNSPGLPSTTQAQGNENLRLGLEVQGAITTPGQEDVYSFEGMPGTEVWIDLGQTTYALDSELELLSSTGTVLGWSDSSWQEEENDVTESPVYVPSETDVGLPTDVTDGDVMVAGNSGGTATSTTYTLAHTPISTVTTLGVNDSVTNTTVTNAPIVTGTLDSEYGFTVDFTGKVTWTGSAPTTLVDATFDLADSRLTLNWNESVTEPTGTSVTVAYHYSDPTDAAADPSLRIPGQGVAQLLPADQWALDNSGYSQTNENYLSSNPKDAGFSVILPGQVGSTTPTTYMVRVMSKVALVQMPTGTLTDPAGSQITDGSTFTVTAMGMAAGDYTTATNMDPTSATFEFILKSDPDQTPVSGDTAVYYTASDTAATLATEVDNAINSVSSTLDVTANTLIDNTSSLPTGQVTLSGNMVDLSYNASQVPFVRINPVGQYTLQIGLTESEFFPGSSIAGALIDYATTGIEVNGEPMDSPLVASTAETFTNSSATPANPLGSTATNDTNSGNNPNAPYQYVGNLLSTNQEQITWSGNLTALTSTDFYQVNVGEGDTIAQPQPASPEWPVTIKVDYTGVNSGPDTSLYVFNESGQLILIGQNDAATDSLPVVDANADLNTGLTDLNRASTDTDPYIGPVYLPSATGVYRRELRHRGDQRQPDAHRPGQFADPHRAHRLATARGRGPHRRLERVEHRLSQPGHAGIDHRRRHGDGLSGGPSGGRDQE